LGELKLLLGNFRGLSAENGPGIFILKSGIFYFGLAILRGKNPPGGKDQ
jgi:hypothetical protein